MNKAWAYKWLNLLDKMKYDIEAALSSAPPSIILHTYGTELLSEVLQCISAFETLVYGADADKINQELYTATIIDEDLWEEVEGADVS